MKRYLNREELVTKIKREKELAQKAIRRAEILEEDIKNLQLNNDPKGLFLIPQLRSRCESLRTYASNKFEKRIPKLSKALAEISTGHLFNEPEWGVKV